MSLAKLGTGNARQRARAKRLSAIASIARPATPCHGWRHGACAPERVTGRDRRSTRSAAAGSQTWRRTKLKALPAAITVDEGCSEAGASGATLISMNDV